MTGPAGYFRSAELSSQEFIELVQVNWRKRLHAMSVFPLELYSEQVKRCTEVALSCVEVDRSNRPTIGVIVNKLNETETMIQNALRKDTGPNRQEKDTGSPVDQSWWGSFINWEPFQPKIKVIDWAHRWRVLHTVDIHQWEPCHPNPKKQLLPPVAELSCQYGPMMLLKLGKVLTLVVSSDSAAREVMRHLDTDLADPPQDMAGSCINGLVFAPYGHQLREMRKRCILDLVGPKQVARLNGILAEELAHLIRSVAAARPAAGAINVSEKVAMLSYDVLSRAVLGSGTTQQDECLNELKEVFTLLGGISLVDLFPSSQLVGWLSTGKLLHGTRSYSRIQSIIADVANGRKAARVAGVSSSTDDGEDMLDVLLRLQEDNSGFLLTTEIICVVIFEIFGVATEALGITLNWAMMELLNNPEAMAKAQLEVREVLGQDRAVIIHTDLGKLQYLQMVVKEVLRLHPPFPLLFPREAREDSEIMGYDVPKGTHIYVNVFSISRDPEHWDYPEEFNPERFVDNTVDDYWSWTYIPFGSGRRSCPGRSFSKSIIEIALANLLYHFDWVLPDGASREALEMPEKYKVAVDTSSDLQLIAIPYPRSKVKLI